MSKRVLLAVCFLYIALVTSVLADPGVIVIYGDTRTNAEVHRNITRDIISLKPGIVFHTGDLAMDGRNESDWKAFLDISAVLRKNTRFYPVFGNHEHHSKLYFDSFQLPNNEMWYAVDYNGIHFIALDTESPIEPGSEQAKWLEADLRSDRSKFRIVICHHPPYGSGNHGDELDLRHKLVPALEKYKVDMLFNGHNHCYERQEVNGIYYITTGGGGAPLYSRKIKSPNCRKFLEVYNFCKLELVKNKLSVTVYDDKMNVIDEFSKTK